MSAKFTPAAALRNVAPITQALRTVLPQRGLVLEIASGSGTHVAAFARAFPRLTWQPTDPDDDARASIAAHIAETDAANIHAPLALDVTAAPWPVAAADAIVCINMIHISPWSAAVALFENAALVLPAGAPLFTYGPYILHGDFIAESNIDFDRSLKARNPAWGLREVDDVADLAKRSGFAAPDIAAMPANNLALVFRRL